MTRCPRSSTDRMRASGARDMGSIPIGDTRLWQAGKVRE